LLGLQLKIHCVNFTQTRSLIRYRASDFALLIHAFECRSLPLHVELVVDLVVNAMFLVYSLSTLVACQSELQCFKSIELLQMTLMDRVTRYACVIGYDIVLSP